MTDTVSKRFDHLEILIEKGFASVAEEFQHIDERLEAHDEQFKGIGKRFDSIDNELRAIRSELSHISRRLDILEEQVGGMKGFSKEIDELRERIKEIEKHVGLKTV